MAIKKNIIYDKYKLPDLDLLSSANSESGNDSLESEAISFKKKLNTLFKSFSLNAKVDSYEIGTSITLYKIKLATGERAAKLTKLKDEINLIFGTSSTRFVNPIPGTSLIGIEVPNSEKGIVLLRDLLEEEPRTKGELVVPLGKSTNGTLIDFDLAKAPHMLIAGTTGSGKSVAINVILSSLLMKFKPHEVRLVLVDPKMVEFTSYAKMPHLLQDVVNDPKDADVALESLVNEMEARYKLLAKEGVRNIIEYKEKVKNANMPYIVVVIDEMADLMMTAKETVESSIVRIAQKARAAGIHMILATQRPTAKVVTGLIKANVPSRLAFALPTDLDSRIILDQGGAEKLDGNGDMLASIQGKDIIRGQGAYVSNSEIEALVDYAKKEAKATKPKPKPKPKLTTEEAKVKAAKKVDPLLEDAKKIISKLSKVSVSDIQIALSLSYKQAYNLMEDLEKAKYVSENIGLKPRKVLK